MLDFEYAKALAEVVLDTTCSEKEREVRMEKRSGMYWKNQNLIFLPSRTAMNFILMKPEKLP